MYSIFNDRKSNTIQTKQITKCICYILQLRIILPLKLLLSYLTCKLVKIFLFPCNTWSQPYFLFKYNETRLNADS